MKPPILISTLSQFWEYVCEGGHHALFRYVHTRDEPSCPSEDLDKHNARHQGVGIWRELAIYSNCYFDNNMVSTIQAVSSEASSSPSSHQSSQVAYDYGRYLFHGKLLRISKQVFGHRDGEGERDEIHRLRKHDDTDNQDQGHEWKDLILHRLSPYVEGPITALLPFSFILDLRQDVLRQKNIIPAFRRADWGEEIQTHARIIDCNSIIQNECAVSPSSTCSDGMNTTIATNTRWIHATLIPDYRLAINHPRMSHRSSSNTQSPLTLNDSITIEIKPKAGYITKSPFIHPKHRNIKWNMTRYEIVRRLKNQHDISFLSSSVDKSLIYNHYNPMDFFQHMSSEPPHPHPESRTLSSALHALFTQSTTSNLKIWNNYIKLIPVPLIEESTNHKSPKYILQQILDNGTITNMTMDTNLCLSTLVNNLTLLESLISFILTSEQYLLQNLLQLQRLDVLDADGAILIYDRLVFLCQGDHRRAQTLVNDLSFKAMDTLANETKDHHTSQRGISSSYMLCKPMPPSQHLQFFSPYTFPTESHQLLALLNLMDDFQSWLLDIHNIQSPSNLNVNMNIYSTLLDEVYNNACSLISNLGVNDCVYLLQNWLLSLTMCDVTIFINIVPRIDNGLAGELSQLLDDESWLRLENMELVRHQSANSSGSIVIKRDGKSMVYCDYKMNIIDWDPKPATKLRELRKREELIQFLSS